jgi:hypothetical protein
MAPDGRKLAATFFRNPDAKEFDRVLVVFDLESYTYQSYPIDSLAQGSRGSVGQLVWVDDGSTLDMFISGGSLVRFNAKGNSANTIATCPACESMAASRLGRIARVDRLGYSDRASFVVTVDGIAVSSFPAELADFQPRSVSWSPSGAYLSVAFDRKRGKDGLPHAVMVILSAGSSPPTIAAVRAIDEDYLVSWVDDESAVVTSREDRVIRELRLRPQLESVLFEAARFPELADNIGKRGIYDAQVSADRRRVAFVSALEVGTQILVVDIPCLIS